MIWTAQSSAKGGGRRCTRIQMQGCCCCRLCACGTGSQAAGRQLGALLPLLLLLPACAMLLLPPTGWGRGRSMALSRSSHPACFSLSQGMSGLGGGPVLPAFLAMEVRERAMKVPPAHRPRMASASRSPTLGMVAAGCGPAGCQVRRPLEGPLLGDRVSKAAAEDGCQHASCCCCCCC